MYEDITFEVLVQRKLDGIKDEVDKREGSIVYNAIASNSVEEQQLYIAVDSILNETFADTASRENLIKRAAERGMKPDPASYAILRGEFNIDVPIGSRFSLDVFNYTVTEKMDTGIFKLQCETIGANPNQYLGTLTPIEYIEGLTSSELTEVLIPGEDEEDTEVFRQRYLNSFESQAFGGNRADYLDKVNKLPGVGGVKVYRAWDGGGTVKLVIISSEFTKPSTILVDSVQQSVDPLDAQGEGLGLAPMFHIVTVVGTDNTIVNIETTATLQTGWTWADVKSSFEAAVDNYFLELSKTWADNDNLIVRISQLETRFLDVVGVVDIANTKINGVEENLVIPADNTPIRGEVIG